MPIIGGARRIGIPQKIDQKRLETLVWLFTDDPCVQNEHHTVDGGRDGWWTGRMMDGTDDGGRDGWLVDGTDGGRMVEHDTALGWTDG